MHQQCIAEKSCYVAHGEIICRALFIIGDISLQIAENIELSMCDEMFTFDLFEEKAFCQQCCRRQRLVWLLLDRRQGWPFAFSLRRAAREVQVLQGEASAGSLALMGGAVLCSDDGIL